MRHCVSLIWDDPVDFSSNNGLIMSAGFSIQSYVDKPAKLGLVSCCDAKLTEFTVEQVCFSVL